MNLIPWLVVAYAVICAVVYFGNRLFMYFPDPARIAPAEAGLDGIEEVELAADDGVTLVAWHAPARQDKPTILYFHGNRANAASRAPKIGAARPVAAVVLEADRGARRLARPFVVAEDATMTKLDSHAEGVA